MGPPVRADADHICNNSRRHHTRDPTPSLTALLMESNYPEPNSLQLTPMELEDLSQDQKNITTPSSFPSKCSRLTPTNMPSPSRVSQCSCTCSETVFLRASTNGWTDYQLADWLVKCVKLIEQNPMISDVESVDIRILLYSSWKELVMLYMAQNNFDFEVTKVSQNRNYICTHNSEDKRSRVKGSARLRPEMSIPSYRHVEQLKFTLGKLCQMRLDEKEYALLRLLMLLNTDLRDLKNSSAVEKASERIHTLLMEYENVCYPNDPLRLSHMLLHLPGVRGFPTTIFENLFFRQIIGEAAVSSVLRELIES